MIENVMKDKAFYFSYQLDLSKSIQANILETVATNTQPPNSITANVARNFPNAVGF